MSFRSNCTHCIHPWPGIPSECQDDEGYTHLFSKLGPNACGKWLGGREAKLSTYAGGVVLHRQKSRFQVFNPVEALSKAFSGGTRAGDDSEEFSDLRHTARMSSELVRDLLHLSRDSFFLKDTSTSIGTSTKVTAKAGAKPARRVKRLSISPRHQNMFPRCPRRRSTPLAALLSQSKANLELQANPSSSAQRDVTLLNTLPSLALLTLVTTTTPMINTHQPSSVSIEISASHTGLQLPIVDLALDFGVYLDPSSLAFGRCHRREHNSISCLSMEWVISVSERWLKACGHLEGYKALIRLQATLESHHNRVHPTEEGLAFGPFNALLRPPFSHQSTLMPLFPLPTTTHPPLHPLVSSSIPNAVKHSKLEWDKRYRRLFPAFTPSPSAPFSTTITDGSTLLHSVSYLSFSEAYIDLKLRWTRRLWFILIFFTREQLEISTPLSSPTPISCPYPEYCNESKAWSSTQKEWRDTAAVHKIYEEPIKFTLDTDWRSAYPYSRSWMSASAARWKRDYVWVWQWLKHKLFSCLPMYLCSSTHKECIPFYTRFCEPTYSTNAFNSDCVACADTKRPMR
ncbi:hypothetical protein BKA70DRAFT_1464715 [Coprinopsis sp. MPI-PUGE-AT-0042]|nr:hypothetical protein BKA70DRAFT_1464715 [Coprinopsis sp. MPI-PUGE-AT-0042]